MECQICYEVFDSNNFAPKILIKCGHSFCKICSERISSKNTFITCPICREITKITKNKDLPTNYSLLAIIERLKENNETKNILEKYKFFNDKNFKNITEKIIRNSEPKVLNLKKIVNDDFIYLEEIKNCQNYSIFSTIPRRNNRYNFNRNSLFAYFFNEYSATLFPFRKASKCEHSFSCMEHLLKKIFKYTCIAFLLKYPFKYILSYFVNGGNYVHDSETNLRTKFYIKILRISFFALFSMKEIYRCFRNFQIDEFLKQK